MNFSLEFVFDDFETEKIKLLNNIYEELELKYDVDEEESSFYYNIDGVRKIFPNNNELIEIFDESSPDGTEEASYVMKFLLSSDKLNIDLVCLLNNKIEKKFIYKINNGLLEL